jgi:hypothetical protein
LIVFLKMEHIHFEKLKHGWKQAIVAATTCYDQSERPSQ